MDDEKIIEIIEILESLLEDMPSKARLELNVAIKTLKNINSDIENLLKAQDQLENIVNISNIDAYSRNEINNILAEIEEMCNCY